jgi:hypothetical protein
VLYMGFNLGSNSHRLQATSGFQMTAPPPKYLGLSTKGLYILSCIVGIVYIALVAALLPDAENVPAPQALQVAVGGSVFFGIFLTIVGVRLGWSSVEACAPDANPARTLRLVNPAGVRRQQLIYLAAGVFVVIGAMSSLSTTYPRWAGHGSHPSTPTVALPNLDDLLADKPATATDPRPAAAPPPAQAPLSASAPPPVPEQEAPPAPTLVPTQAQVAPSAPVPQNPASSLSIRTYGNVVASYFPGESAVDAVSKGLSKIKSSLSVSGIDYLGYPDYELECEKDGQCFNGTGTPFGSAADNAKEMFPVNPADIQQYALQCNVICHDSQGQIIGSAP